MSILVSERRVEEVVAGWRRGLEEDGAENPAGPLFAGGDFTEYEIIMTGPGSTHVAWDTCNFSQVGPICCPL